MVTSCWVRIISNSHSTPHSPGTTPRVDKVEPINLMSSLDSPTSILDLNTKRVHETYKPTIGKSKIIKGKWRFKYETLEDFDKDNLLCMNAICEVYYHYITNRKHLETRIVWLGYVKSCVIISL